MYIRLSPKCTGSGNNDHISPVIIAVLVLISKNTLDALGIRFLCMTSHMLFHKKASWSTKQPLSGSDFAILCCYDRFVVFH